MKYKNYLPVLAAGIFVLVWISVLCIVSPGESLWFGWNSVYELNTGWSVDGQSDGGEEITLPTKLEVATGETFAISQTLAADFPEGMTLCLRASQQNLTVLLDGEEIYADIEDSSATFHAPMVSAWHLVRLPLDVGGKTLTIILQSPYEVFAGYINPIVYGHGADILFNLAKTHWLGLLLILLIFFIGLLMIMISLITRQVSDGSLVYLGLFAMAISCWFFMESFMAQFFFGNRFLLGGGTYMMLTLFPIPFLLYVRKAILPQCKTPLIVFTVLFALNFIACSLLQLFGVYGFFETVIITHFLIFCSIAFLAFALSRAIIRDKNKMALRFALFVSILFFVAIFELIRFYRDDFDSTSILIRFGMLAFITLLGIDSGITLRGLLRRYRESTFYKQMAFHDILTGGKNRAAFSRDVDRMMKNPLQKEIRLVLMDLNSLKYINDLYGHQEGDWAIKKCYECMVIAFGDEDACYRIGGDEFACILRGIGNGAYEDARNRFIQCIQEENLKTAYAFDIAIGSAVYNDKIDANFTEFFNRTDQIMYQDKNRKKSTHAIMER